VARATDAVGDRWVKRRAAAPPADPRRILFIRLDHLGDVLFATPALRALRQAFPRAHLTLLAGPWALDAVAVPELADTIHVVEVPWFRRHRRSDSARRGGERYLWWRVLDWIRTNRFDVGLDPRGDVRHLAWMWAAGIPVRIGCGATGGGWSLTHEVHARDVHEVERNLDAVRVVAPASTAGDLVAVTAAPAAQVTALLETAGVTPDARLLIVHAGAGYATKRWEPAALAACVDRCVEAGLTAVFVGTAADRDPTAAVRAAMRHPAFEVLQRTSLAVLASLVERAAVFLGHDSGPSHVAVATGRPVVLVYSGVNDPRRWGPWRGRAVVVRHPVHCSPCGLPRCPFAHECMREIDPAAVASDVLRLWREAR
jgi:ADP-heptose:LPS heptosyltransferase